MLPRTKDDFIGLAGTAHLASGGQPPLLCSHKDAFDRFARDKARGMAGYEAHWHVGYEVKERLARMTHLKVDDFALLGNASEGIARVVSSIDWRTGDNAVVSALDYASGRFALAKLRDLGVTNKIVDSEGWWIDPDALIAACDERTRLVYVSHVNAHTGQRIDLSRLSSALSARGIALLVDASHSLGVLPVEGRLCDFLVASTYKFLLGPHTGILAWNRRRWPRFEPTAIGWHGAVGNPDPGRYDLLPDARRAEIGNSNHLSVYLLKESLDYLSATPVDDLEHHVLSLGGKLLKGLGALNVTLLTPEADCERGANISFLHPAPRRLAELAAGKNILVWGQAGRVRASMHLFVEGADIERFLAWLPEGMHQTEGLTE